jgi:SAM-dependent methyltransferase
LQFFTALDLLNNGARKVLLVDPVFENKGHLNVLKHHYKEYLNKCRNVHCLNTDKIQVYSSWDFLPAVMNHSIDIIFSHFVLEHVPDLKRYFSQTHKLLIKNGIMFSCVDLTDHTYQIFDSKKWMKWVYRKNMLCHLKYSEKMNRFLSDKRTWVNRLLFPVYVKIADECGFGVVTKKLFFFDKVKIHEDVLKKLPVNYCDEELFVSHFELTLSPS